jgi:hypothetical protein
VAASNGHIFRLGHGMRWNQLPAAYEDESAVHRPSSDRDKTGTRCGMLTKADCHQLAVVLTSTNLENSRPLKGVLEAVVFESLN